MKIKNSFLNYQLKKIADAIEKNNGKIEDVNELKSVVTVKFDSREDYFKMCDDLIKFVNFPLRSSGPKRIDFNRYDPSIIIAYHNLGTFKFVMNNKND